MRPIPLFDTNIFSDLQEGKISAEDWQHILRLRPRKGWPLSAITVLELLVGVHRVAPEKFGQSKKQLDFARELSKGRVLDEPRVLLCENILHRSFPFQPISKSGLTKLMEITCLANSKADILQGRVEYKRSIYRGKRSAGIDTALISDLMAGPKEDWVKQIETQLFEIYPNWREHLTQTGLRLPAQLRNRLESPEVWELSREKFSESMLSWLGGDAGGPRPSEFADRIDAVLRFTFWVMRESLLRRYSYEKHESDIYDQIQLHYLANEKYIFVTNDQKLRNRLAGSSQANRILCFNHFLKSL
jgi:hypothetical protein